MSAAAAPEVLMRAEHLGKDFGGLVAVGDVSLSIPAGGVLGLVGERGREVGEFLETLGPQGRSRACVVVSTSDQSPLLRIRAALAATRAVDALDAVLLALIPGASSCTKQPNSITVVISPSKVCPSSLSSSSGPSTARRRSRLSAEMWRAGSKPPNQTPSVVSRNSA